MGEEMRKNKQSPVVFAKKPAVVATQVALAVMAQLAYAQQPVQTAERVERVEITGSRIPTIEAEGPSPVTVMTAQEIRFDGLSKTEDLLNNLPQVFASQNSNFANGATGTAQVDLRHLGPTRNLVLVNGRRLPPGSPQSGSTTAYAADLNQIPAPLIQRVEVLTGGASAVYGSDAISGVVNFIMNDRFEGLQVDLYHSFYNHFQQNPNGIADIVNGRHATNPQQFNVPGDVNDGAVNGVSLTMGRNFADNKGNGTLFLAYKKEAAVTQASRDFSACSLNSGDAFNAPGVGCGGSSTSATGRFSGPGGRTTLDTNPGSPTFNGPRAFSNGTDLFNFAPYNYYRRPSEQFNMNAFAHLDLTPRVRAYTEIGMHDYHTDAVIAPSGIFGQVVPMFDANPLLSPAWKAAMGIPAGSSANVTVQKRNVEGGGRDDDLRYTSYRGVAGLKGEISKTWNYDVFVQSGKVLYQEVYRNDFSTQRTFKALDVITDPVTGLPACRTAVSGADPLCVPWNIWAVNGVSAASLSYLQVPLVANGRTEQNVMGGTLQADLGQYGWRMPGARNGLALALGVERRKEKLNLDTDVSFSSFDGAGQGGPVIGIPNKSLGVEELYGEIRIPFLENKPFAQTLSLSASGRRSNYSTQISTNTWGLGAEWAPVKSTRFRGTAQRAVRAPNIVELYQAQGTNLFEMAQDPCDAAAVGRATAAQCARTGLTAAQYADPVISSGLTNTAGQYNYIQGGNDQLRPETATTFTLGVVLNPIRNFTATIDYWQIKIDQAINTPDPAILVNQCIFQGINCAGIRRDPTNGTLWLPGGFATSLLANVGGVLTNGIDLSAGYAGRMGTLGGYGILFNGSYLAKQEWEPFPGQGKYDCAGYYGGTACQNPNPKWRHKVRGTWATPWNMDFALTWRHIAKVDWTGLNPSPLLNQTTAATDAHLEERDYFDLAALWNINKTFSLRAGVNNIFDKDPPIVGSTATGPGSTGNGNTFPQTYDALGRLVFMNLTMKF
jgi:iron complex outermembrane receptor protein